MTKTGTTYKAEISLGPNATGPSHQIVRVEVSDNGSHGVTVTWGSAPTSHHYFADLRAAINFFQNLCDELKTIVPQ